MMTFVNEMTPRNVRPRQVLEPFVLLLAPYAPHMAEELWQHLGHSQSLMREPFPAADPRWLVEDTIEVPVQVNGKVRDRLQVPPDITEAAIRALAESSEKVQNHLADKQIVKFIYVPRRMVTIAVK